jgi:hypothetical protein
MAERLAPLLATQVARVRNLVPDGPTMESVHKFPAVKTVSQGEFGAGS